MKRLVACLLCLLPFFLHAEDKKLSVGGFSFVLSAPWTEGQNSGMMTKAVLSYPADGGSPLQAKVYDFGGPSGGIDANVQRWISQFEGTPEVKKEELTFGGTKVVLVTASGTYLDGMPGGPKTPKPDSTLMGAIVAGTDSNVFFKMAGPKAPMAKAQADFKKLVTSPFAKQR
jgi:hypothetical protein